MKGQGYVRLGGRRVPEMPRKTLVATVSLPSLTMELLMAWSVVV